MQCKTYANLADLLENTFLNYMVRLSPPSHACTPAYGGDESPSTWRLCDRRAPRREPSIAMTVVGVLAVGVGPHAAAVHDLLQAGLQMGRQQQPVQGMVRPQPGLRGACPRPHLRHHSHTGEPTAGVHRPRKKSGVRSTPAGSWGQPLQGSTCCASRMQQPRSDDVGGGDVCMWHSPFRWGCMLLPEPSPL